MMRGVWLPLLALAALAIAPLAGFSASYEMTLMARAMILAMAAVSLSFLVGGAGLVSLGHAASVGVGAYAVAILDANGFTDAAQVLPVAIGAAAIFALLTGAIAIRTSGVHFIMITLAFGQMAFFTASSLSAYGGDDGYTLYSRTEVAGARLLENRLAFHYICLGLLAASWAVASMLLASRFGRVLRAARENAQRAEAVGFTPYPYRLVGYGIAGAMAGVAGVLLVNATEFVSPAMLSWQRSGELLFMVILGGVGRLWGAILGALVFVGLETWLAELTPHWKMIFGPLLVVSVIALRGGLAGLVAPRHG
ncbi:branched-chain amino acid ABC transporter permease [Roseomonas sp. HJA6]|uniref:Branched-chain amino acid ABC transporter permease n=1 Tax=Roseomonas alba TaxID=2846776 RepID=A0ABS7A4V1_9PROT|nr:branched-chain amino acid ABC transporter permease [Neoroseomonas alba]MBW6397329.1 branched-chain amino acid ABC transporter permease [Neoroseomonas alba]